MCRDFLELGYSKFVVDPGIRLAYSADVARRRYTQKVPAALSTVLSHNTIHSTQSTAFMHME